MSGYFMMRRDDFLRVRDDLNPAGFKIMLEIVARLKPDHIAEVPYIFGRRERGESKLSGRVVLAYIGQLCRLFALRCQLPMEFVKFGTVGVSGVLVNLAAMAILLRFTSWRDWKSSAVATLLASASNYVFNNAWTFRDRSHSGFMFLGRYLYYLTAAVVGLGITTASYAALTSAIGDSSGRLSTLTLLACQFIAIIAGTASNYLLNRSFTWPRNSCQKSELSSTRPPHNESAKGASTSL
jgi:dolichol-phosphate mannosyltransferase